MNISSELVKELDYQIGILKAYKEGKTIQFKTKNDYVHKYNKNEWKDCASQEFVPIGNFRFDFTLYHFRIKPEPRIIYCVIPLSGYLIESSFNKDELSIRYPLSDIVEFIEKID